MRRFSIAVFCIFVALVSYAQARRRAVDGNAGVTQTVPQPAGASLTGLTAAQNASFNGGRGQFVRNWNNGNGLGPVFNERACSDYHNAPSTGGGSARLVTRFARRTGGVFDPLTSLGGSLLQDHAIGGNGTHIFVPEQVPAEATIVVRRRTTPVFGLGLVDATPDSEFIALAALHARRWRGRPRQHDRQHPNRHEDRRPLRLESAGADAVPIFGRRNAERDGDHHARFPE